MKLLVFAVCFIMLLPVVTSEVNIIDYFIDEVKGPFFVKPVIEPMQPEPVVFYYSRSVVDKKSVVKEEPLPSRIYITDKGFAPEKTIIKAGQTVIWKNKQKNLQALVYGVREISHLKSQIMKRGQTFSWTFTEEGEYTYVDGVVIGRAGRIIVG